MRVPAAAPRRPSAKSPEAKSTEGHHNLLERRRETPRTDAPDGAHLMHPASKRRSPEQAMTRCSATRACSRLLRAVGQYQKAEVRPSSPCRPASRRGLARLSWLMAAAWSGSCRMMPSARHQQDKLAREAGRCDAAKPSSSATGQHRIPSRSGRRSRRGGVDAGDGEHTLDSLFVLARLIWLPSSFSVLQPRPPHAGGA